jgi:predicted permease
MSDFTYALRTLRRSPAFALTAVSVLALGIGINSALFSVVRELVFSPRPYPEADRVVQLYCQDRTNPLSFRNFSYPTYRDILENNTVFSGVLAHNITAVSVGQGQQARRAFADVVSANYFSTLGVPPARGRGFLTEEERPGAEIAVTIVSHVYWAKTGFDPGLVGRTVRINNRTFTVVGIAPEGFSGTMMLLGPEFYFPLGMFDIIANDFQDESHRTLSHREAWRLFLVGRLKPGVTAAEAAPALTALAGQLERQFPKEMRNQTFLTGPVPRLSSSSTPVAEEELTLSGTLLLATGAGVLLVACLNLAGMLLARGAAQRHEFAVRLALGAGRRRLLRQLLTQGLVLALLGGLLGLILSVWSTQLLARSVSAMLPVALFFPGGFNPAVFAATLGFCLVATLFSALGPARRLAGTDVVSDLKQSGGGPPPARAGDFRPRQPLVVAQLAVSLALLAVAGLFVHSAYRAATLDIGFKDADNTLVVEANAALGGLTKEGSLQTYQAVGARLAALPGVRSASFAATIPFGNLNISRPVQRYGVHAAAKSRPASAAEGLAYDARWNSVGADYFTTMGLPVVRGRSFTALETERPGAPPVAIIDEALARRLWPEGDALGQRISFARSDAPRAAGGPSVESAAGESEDVAPLGETENVPVRPSDPASLEIVGIVPVVRGALFSPDAGNALYVPFAQGYQDQVYFHVRFAGAPPPGAPDRLRRELLAAAPALQLFKLQTFREHLTASADLWIARSVATLFALLGALALLLAVVSVYGAMAYMVTRRTREIGIRMAIGARPREVVWLVLQQGLRDLAWAVGLGLAGALVAGLFLADLLYGTGAVDPLALAAAVLLLGAATLLACWLPARRAAKVNPMVALRAE